MCSGKADDGTVSTLKIEKSYNFLLKQSFLNVFSGETKKTNAFFGKVDSGIWTENFKKWKFPAIKSHILTFFSQKTEKTNAFVQPS